MVTSTWSQLTADLDQEALAKLTAFRDYCRSLPDVEERVHSAEIAYARKRTFASAYIKSHYLEVGIELLSTVADPPPGAPHPSPKAMADVEPEQGRETQLDLPAEVFHRAVRQRCPAQR